jgi:hypothetical protein
MAFSAYEKNLSANELFEKLKAGKAKGTAEGSRTNVTCSSAENGLPGIKERKLLKSDQ